MKKLYNFRLDPTLVGKVDVMPGTRTFHITEALQKYLTKVDTDTYSVGMVDLLKTQIEDLHRDKAWLQDQVKALTVARNPSLLEWFRYRLRGSD